MISRKLEWIIKGQQGFTLIEVLVALAITGIIGLGAATTTVQVLNQGARNSDYTTASSHAMNAVYWISRDTQMSQTVTPDGVSGFPLTLEWTEWDSSEYQVIYSLDDDRLMRTYSVNGGELNETLVAQYINSVSDNTTCEDISGVFRVTVTATVGEGARALSVTKTRKITPRPSL